MKKVLSALMAVLVICTFSFFAIASGEDAETSSNGEDGNTTVTVKNAVQVAVADFTAMKKADIEAWANENNLVCKFKEAYSDTVALGNVISQSEKAGVSVNEGSTIEIVLSLGKKPSVEYQNALKKAKSYSDLMHMSKKAIYAQLTSEYGENFPADAAQYAVDNLQADYKANALEKAKSYQENMSMSKSAIYKQLISEYGEKFTKDEAQYAIDHLGD